MPLTVPVKSIRALWIFYKKILFPSLLFSMLFWVISSPLHHFSPKNIGILYLYIAPIFHFVQYHLRLKDELFFYLLLGFSKKHLWVISLGLNFLLFLLTIITHALCYT